MEKKMVNLVVTKKINPSPCCVGIWHMLAGILMVILGTYVWFNPFVSLMALSLYIGIALMIIGAGYICTYIHSFSDSFRM